LRLGLRRRKNDSSPVGSHLPRARFQTAAFLQQVPKTSELATDRPGTAGSFSLPNCDWRIQTKRIVGAPESGDGGRYGATGIYTAAGRGFARRVRACAT